MTAIEELYRPWTDYDGKEQPADLMWCSDWDGSHRFANLFPFMPHREKGVPSDQWALKQAAGHWDNAAFLDEQERVGRALRDWAAEQLGLPAQREARA